MLPYGLGYISTAENWNHHIDRVVIVAGFFILLAGFVVREFSIRRKEKYARIQNHLHRIQHDLRDVTTFLGYQSSLGEQTDWAQVERTFQGEIAHVLDRVADMFLILTDTPCRVALKMIDDPGDGRLYVYALARDGTSAAQNAQMDRKRYEDKQDPLEENDDFHQIFNKHDPFFFSEDLTKRRGYLNSSFAIHGMPPEHLQWWQQLMPSLWWKLPYRSTIVWPIQQLDSRSLSFDSLGCIGFLAVDSADPRVFHRGFDVPLGAGIADAMFHCLNRWHQIKGADSQNEEVADALQADAKPIPEGSREEG